MVACIEKTKVYLKTKVLRQQVPFSDVFIKVVVMDSNKVMGSLRDQVPCSTLHPKASSGPFADNYSSGKWVPGPILPTSWTKFTFHCFQMFSGS